MPKKPTVKDLMEEMIEREIHSCELQYPGCLNNMFVAPAHRHKRLWYKKHPELLWTFNQVLILCQKCHATLEKSRDKTEEEFLRLRGEELIN